MEKYSILVSETFHRDLKNLIHYISHNFDAPFTASDLLDDIEYAVSNLRTMPPRYGLVNDNYLRHNKFRKCLVKHYIIFFKIYDESKTVTIHRILHAKQNWLDIL
ncbi:type II toxin-antitoxin system RelE/ParE family toxin [Aerococcaceae bacterium zg-ZUI334]|uniref:type II toxin-antitoxin system RelE/ParE family toxin n=1 Tax=Aerococcaceae bacterium zg-252 TaxID=2796928 RepID=UPI001BA1FE19|nr:type II toxin-antitoxin system RelE/ParE family toxin [Aerococcaceae bacterium zg-ZUI334]